MTAQEVGELSLASVVATRARGLLAERRMTQGELGMAMGITRSRMSDRLNGSKDFDLDELPLLAQALTTSVEYLLGLTELRTPTAPDVDTRRYLTNVVELPARRETQPEPRGGWATVLTFRRRGEATTARWSA